MPSIRLFSKSEKKWGALGRVVRVVNLELLVPYRCGVEFRQGLWILTCEENIQLAYRTSVVLLRCLPEIMRSSSTSKAGKSTYNLYSVGAT